MKFAYINKSFLRQLQKTLAEGYQICNETEKVSFNVSISVKG